MAKTCALQEWIHAEAEAVADFSQEILGIPISIDAADIEWTDKELCQSFMGAYLELSADEEKIKIFFLSNEEVLMTLAKLMLLISPQDTLSQEDMMDAIKEVVNIISGGIKSRMNERMSGRLLLGLPSFSEKNVIPHQKEVLIGKVLVANMPLFLAVAYR